MTDYAEIRATLEQIAQKIDAGDGLSDGVRALCEQVAPGSTPDLRHHSNGGWRLLFFDTPESLHPGFAGLSREEDGRLEVWTVSDPKRTGDIYRIAQRWNAEYAGAPPAVAHA